jgi:Fe-S oxidoreductase
VIKARSSLLVVECPYCLSMFEESRKTKEEYQKLVVKDISEIVLEMVEDSKS